MKFSKKKMAIFYIDKDQGSFFTNTFSKPKELNLPQDVFSHLEIINSQKLNKLIEEFLEINKIEPSELFILLGKNTTFERDFTNIPRTERSIEMQKFLDIVPFEETLNKVFKIQKKEKIVVANKQFCEEIIAAFKAKEFNIFSIVPQSIVFEVLPQLKGKLDLPLLLKKIESIKNYGLFSHSLNQDKTSRYLWPIRNFWFLNQK